MAVGEVEDEDGAVVVDAADGEAEVDEEDVMAGVMVVGIRMAAPTRASRPRSRRIREGFVCERHG